MRSGRGWKCGHVDATQSSHRGSHDPARGSLALANGCPLSLLFFLLLIDTGNGKRNVLDDELQPQYVLLYLTCLKQAAGLHIPSIRTSGVPDPSPEKLSGPPPGSMQERAGPCRLVSTELKVRDIAKVGRSSRLLDMNRFGPSLRNAFDWDLDA